MSVLISSLFFLSFLFTPLGSLLENSLLTHVLIEFPLLFIIGIYFGNYLANYFSKFLEVINYAGIPGIILTSLVLGFWMIPRWLDASVNTEVINLIKYFSLTFLAGLPFALSWPKLHSIAKGVIIIEFLAMLFRIGWIYEISPYRLCNNYLLNEQQLLGKSFIYIGVILCIYLAMKVFFKPDLKIFN